MLLTQSTTPIIGWIAILLGYIMDGIFRVLSAFGIQNIGLCIIIFTFLVRLLMLPLTIKQQKFTKINQAMQPEINKIQKKYRNKKDQASMQKQNEEIQAVYDKYGTNPTGGCMQLIVQFPIFLALYQVIRKIPAYIPQVKAQYITIVDSISNQSGSIETINKIAESLNLQKGYVNTLANDATRDQIIDVLSYFREDTWAKLASAFPQASDVISSVSSKIISMNDFMFGINVSQTPGFRISVYLLIPIIAGIFQYLSFKTMQQPDMKDNPAAGMNKSMSIVMPLMSMYFCIIVPAGLGIYWVSSALFQCVQQIVINKYMEKADLDKMIEKNRAKAEKKKAKGKKSFMEKIMDTSSKAEAAKQEYNGKPANTISEIAAINTKKIKAHDDQLRDSQGNLKNINMDHMGEITKNAYLVYHYDEENKTRGGKK